MEIEKPINISLTGTNSHSITIPAGQGGFSIGAIGMDKKKFDVLVEKDLPINWNCFNTLFTPHGKQNAHLYPNGDWPRFFHYWGDDIGYIEWSKKRKIEEFFLHPGKSISIDLSNARISRFHIDASENPIVLTLGDCLRWIHLSGNIEHFSIHATNENPSFSFAPKTSKDKSKVPFKLPNFKALNAITSLHITVEPSGQAFDCESLLQFPDLENLDLAGNIANLACLKNFENLQSLGIRYSPYLENFPSLNSWKNLKSFIGWNIDEKEGKRLSIELKQLKKEKELDYSTVTKLRSKTWFATEYGIPFANWETKNARIATKAYKTALTEISKAKTEKDIRIAITQLIQIINTLPNIETVEREDTGTAVYQLIEASLLNISHETGRKWFDEIRNF
ncbi:MAG: hypothetical protein ABIQ40_00880 [Bacteroidia bacterium]